MDKEEDQDWKIKYILASILLITVLIIGAKIFQMLGPKIDEVYLNILDDRLATELSSPCSTRLVISRQEHALFKKYVQGEIKLADFDTTALGFYFFHSPLYCNPNFIAGIQCMEAVYCDDACLEILQLYRKTLQAFQENDHDTVRISLQQIDVQQSLHPDCFID